MREFEIIKRFFFDASIQREDVSVGNGDDAAVLNVPPHSQLVVCTDTLVSGVHFFEDASAFDVGYKSLAVNLSDLAAMGAEPTWFTLAITLPESDAEWLEGFSSGLFSLASIYDIELVGGDTTQGPLSITIQTMGTVPNQQAILRSGAKEGDLIFVSGYLGDANLALAILKQQTVQTNYYDYLMESLHRPVPRVALGMALRTIASAAIDISDGLAADLNHLLEASQVGAEVVVDLLPISEALSNSTSPTTAIDRALNGGDDYELCFTVPAANLAAVEKVFTQLAIPCTCIGKITQQKQLTFLYSDGMQYNGRTQGFQHF